LVYDIGLTLKSYQNLPSPNVISAVKYNDIIHATCCPLLNYIRTVLDNLYSSGCSIYLVRNRVNK